MRGRTLIFLLLVATAARADDFGWLEGEWVSDADATMAENALKIDMEPARPFPDESLRSECFKPADD